MNKRFLLIMIFILLFGVSFFGCQSIHVGGSGKVGGVGGSGGIDIPVPK